MRCSFNPLPPPPSYTFTANKVPFLRPHPFLNCHMGDQSTSAHFQTLFDSALQAYEKNTGVSLADHPLAAQLQDCHSVESITTLLQHQAKNVADFRGKTRVMKLIESTVSTLSTLSANTALGGSISLVRQNTLMGYFTSLTTFSRRSHPQTQYKLASPSYSLYVPFVAPTCIPCKLCIRPLMA
jgi:hypothetical protein